MTATKADKPSIVEALASVMEDVRAVRKGDRNQQQGYVFRGVDAVVNAVGPALRKHGVVVVPICEQANYRDVQTSTGKSSRECTVMVRFVFHGPAGDSIECVTPGESMDFSDKGAPKAMSVAFRIALLQALCLPTDDTDPDAQNYERAVGSSGSSNGHAGHEHGANTTPDTPGEARADLGKRAKEVGMTLDDVSAMYTVEFSTDVATETDAAKIRRFTSTLSPEMATNGATT